MRRPTLQLLAVVIALGVSLASEPPQYLNYQGVLRDAADNPLSGTYSMTFTFWDAQPSGSGSLLLTDAHGAVTATSGAFNVLLGEGSITSGEYSSMRDMFANEPAVWLQVQVNADPPIPTRIRIVASGYALNASRLAGKSYDQFLTTTSDPQTKSGPLTISATVGPGLQVTAGTGNGISAVGSLGVGIEASGFDGGGHFLDRDASGEAWCATGDYGIQAAGNQMGGYFSDRDNGGYAYVGYGYRGIQAVGNQAGAVFQDPENRNSAWIAYKGQGRGIDARGLTVGGYFVNNTTPSNEVSIATQTAGVVAKGQDRAGSFTTASGTGVAYLAQGNYGIYASGSQAGGSFDVVEIRGGSDVAEPFPVRNSSSIPEGAVVVIDPSGTGALLIAAQPYDSRVAGIVSGAGGIRPGIVLTGGRPGADERYVALTGRAYCWATARNDAIRPGDLLTTSDLPGHAMKATDPERSQGAILGKAMTSLDEGEGLVLVLVNLQ